MNTTYPVHYSVEPPAPYSRIQLAVRFVAFVALGVAGLSFGGVFIFAYLALPVFAASRLARPGSAETYVTRDGPRILDTLRWFAAVSAWAGLISEHLPGSTPEETVRLEVERSAHPTTAGAALVRVISGIPSALVLGVLCWFGVLVWLWAAMSVLFVQRIGPGAFNYLVGLQRWSIRLLAYQASLVDDYPPFSFSDLAPPVLPGARATV